LSRTSLSINAFNSFAAIRHAAWRLAAKYFRASLTPQKMSADRWRVTRGENSQLRGGRPPLEKFFPGGKATPTF
jgi:hypothetical protein